MGETDEGYFRSLGRCDPAGDIARWAATWHYEQLEALKNAQSVTGRIFTKKEAAQKHCQVREGIAGSRLT